MKNSILNFAASLVIAAFCFISCDKSSNQENTFKYLAVQIDEGDNWSIVDEDGNIVVDREYSSDYKISPISNDGTYWVYSDSEKRYQLFSIDSPKHPIINTEYEQALRFVNNKAFVCDGNNPIQIINEKGEIIKTLPKDICEVSLPAKLVSQHKRFLYKNNKGLYGYLDKEGNIIIPAKYQNAKHFSDDLALVKREINSSQWDVIDQFGEVVYGRIDENKYDLDYDYSFSNGMIAATEVNEEGALVYLNKNGEIALRPKKIYKKGPQYECGPEGFSFKDGIAVVIDKSDNVCVIDEQGECIIRPGKYSKIHFLGNGHFAVASNENNKWKIVDINDNPISDNSFGQLLYLKLGDKYIAYDKVFYLVNQKGEEVKNVEFDNIDWVANNQITYVDFEHIAAELVQNLDSTGYTPLNGNIRPKEIASIFNLAPQENLRNKRYIELPSDTIDNIWVEVSVNFNARAQVEKTHYETVSDGWFAYRRTISDGWNWNDDAELADIYLEIKNLPFYSSNSLQNLCKKIEEALLQKGFKKLDDQYSYEACNGNSYTVISLNSRDKFSITIYPNRNFSELDNECF
ncbi:MAG: WG repeat-containing protein [Bacteroidaceae bacterium]|nr:WG repeat-containing protein [Bacteroidaceae bacterium]